MIGEQSQAAFSQAANALRQIMLSNPFPFVRSQQPAEHRQHPRDIDAYVDIVWRDQSHVHPEDVICTSSQNSSHQANVHEGNVYFRRITSEHIRRHTPQDLLRPTCRAQVAVAIVQEIHGRNGRFLGRTVRGTLKQLSPRLSVRWVSFIIKRAAEAGLDDDHDVGGDHGN